MKLRYWLKTALKIAGLVLMFVTIQVLVRLLMDDEFVLEDSLLLAGAYLVVIGAMMCAVQGAFLYKKEIPLAISFGETRKGVLWGLQIFRIGYTAVLALAAGLFFLYKLKAPSPLLLSLLLLFLGIYLIFHAVGQILPAIYFKFRGVGLVIACCVLLVVFVCGLVAFLNAVDNDFLPAPTVAMSGTVLGAGTVVYLLASVLERNSISRYVVKL